MWVMGHSLFSDKISVTGVPAESMSLNKLSTYYLAMGLNNNYCKNPGAWINEGLHLCNTQLS